MTEPCPAQRASSLGALTVPELSTSSQALRLVSVGFALAVAGAHVKGNG
jgi:hypothetical protein